jgi:hypothetical protein
MQGNYEQNRSSGEVSYVAAVNRARASADARMGSLDGVWSAVGADGRPVMDLVLSDRGPSKPVEGALSLNDTDPLDRARRFRDPGRRRDGDRSLDQRTPGQAAPATGGARRLERDPERSGPRAGGLPGASGLTYSGNLGQALR